MSATRSHRCRWKARCLDLRTSEIKTAERPNDVFITVKQFPNIESTAMDNALRAHLAATFPQNLHGDWVRNAESVGPKIGSELKTAAIYSVIFALLGILIYVSIRFEWTFAVAATVAPVPRRAVHAGCVQSHRS